LNDRPTLFKEQSFWGLLCTQFLGAFNDNVFKQLILLLAVPAVLAGVQNAVDNGPKQDVQGWVNTVFSLPFVLFSGFAGYLSDRFPKRRVIVCAKFAEIVIMSLGMIAFFLYDTWGMAGTWTVLFLMGTHSAFFGPGKYGILPELFRKEELPKANGLILMTTFLAIIFGSVVAGNLMTLVKTNGELHPSRLWIGSCFCIVIAAIGTLASLFIRKTPAARPDAKLSIDDWGLAAPIRSLLYTDRPLLYALLASSVFWMVSGLTVPVVNRLGKSQLLVDEVYTSYLVAAIAIGIMTGAILAGLVFKRFTPRVQVTVGLIGMISALLALGTWSNGGSHPLGYRGCFVSLIVLGTFAAVYSVPLQVFIQQRPPADLKGRLIGTMNQANFIGILLSGPLYQAFEAFSASMNWPISSVFRMLAVFLVPLAIFFRLGR
jgi:MFS family permease